MRRAAVIVTMFLIFGLLAGCGHQIKGVMRNSGEHVKFQRYTGLCLDSLMVTLPDGETFIGYQTAVSPDSACMPDYHQTYASYGDGHTVAGESESILYGDRVNMMHCRYQLPASGSILSVGTTTGVCRLSDSRTIDIHGQRDD